MIQSAPQNLRAKVARVIAAKLSLASRTDQFSGKDNGKEMRNDVENQVRKIVGK